MWQQIRQWSLDGEWQLVKDNAPHLISLLEGDDLARVYLYLSTAYSSDATTHADWTAALDCVRAGRRAASKGGDIYGWATEKLAHTLSEMGALKEARSLATEYLAEYEDSDIPEYITANVYRVMGRISYLTKNYSSARSWYRKALFMYEKIGMQEVVNRIRSTNVVWANVRLGNVDEAKKEILPAPAVGCEYLWYGSMAFIALAEKRYADAVEYGRLALNGKRLGYDYLDAAEVCAVLATASRFLGNSENFFRYSYRSVAYAYVQCAVSPLTLESKGGERKNEATADWVGGVRVGCRFCTGVG